MKDVMESKRSIYLFCIVTTLGPESGSGLERSSGRLDSDGEYGGDIPVSTTSPRDNDKLFTYHDLRSRGPHPRKISINIPEFSFVVTFSRTTIKI